MFGKLTLLFDREPSQNINIYFNIIDNQHVINTIPEILSVLTHFLPYIFMCAP